MLLAYPDTNARGIRKPGFEGGLLSFGTWSVRVAVVVLEYDIEVRGLHYVEYLCLRGVE